MSSEMRVLAGVDEAGLGPLLGPFALGYSVFRAPRASRNLWSALESAVSRVPGDDPRRFCVLDSKQLFDRTPRGEQRLEATALGFLSLLDPARRPPATALALVCARPRELACDPSVFVPHPWFAELAPALPRCQDARMLELRVERLWRALGRAQIALADAGVRVVPEAELNRSYRETGNKHTSTWKECVRVVRYLWERFAPGGMRCVVDRQGGRSHYGGLLARDFPEARVELVRERAGVSEYRMIESSGERRMQIVFAEKGERRSFAVALASCLAKYARETCMQAFNAYFSGLDPALKPTAGYRNDAHRWLEDAHPAIERAGIDRALLIRDR